MSALSSFAPGSFTRFMQHDKKATEKLRVKINEINLVNVESKRRNATRARNRLKSAYNRKAFR